MEKINILKKTGMLTKEDRKEKLVHGCDYINFETCLDLSEPVKMTAYGNSGKVSLEKYSNDIASFICWWTLFVFKDLNGFSGFSHVKFVPTNFTIVQPTNEPQN